MMRTTFLLLLLSPCLLLAQPRTGSGKYPSLLWEISGNGLSRPSYLFGTMHVSSKVAFHLADSFYLGIRNADVVALETNPESWQEDMSKYELGRGLGRDYNGFFAAPNEYLTSSTLEFYKYDKKIARSLYNNPSTINNLLYRTYGNASSDFEEDTYLDMYIYQCGKKWGKKVAGVENYAESMKLMQEAYVDAARDKSKRRVYDIEEEYSTGKLQEAYRKGNLDQLDSIHKLNSVSAAFDEKFLYKRNEIQAHSIDSILKTKASLFVGVGAAHLPGTRGVIEILRRMGYSLRPIMMGERDSRHKEEVEKVRVPVLFSTQTSEDGFFSVDIPGKFYASDEDASIGQQQFADMANGSYYMVSRIMTNAWMWGQHPDAVAKKIDSMLYENIPGKLISKKRMERNGFPGFDIINRTRRGDMQRYHIFVTPFEVIVFKMSGNGDYIKNGEEADKFFNSIRFREYQKPAQEKTWITYSPPFGGFSITLPHEPFIGNDGSWIYDAEDQATHTQFRVIRSDIHNYHFVEEDSFDLGLMDESFSASEFIGKKLSRKHTRHQGYPALDCQYRDKQGWLFSVRFLVQGPHYYTLVARGRKENPRMKAFLESFRILPVAYPQSREHTDTSLYFTVESPVFPDREKERMVISRFGYYNPLEDEEETESDRLDGGAFRSRVIGNDTTGEKIFISFMRLPVYSYSKDSSDFSNNYPYSFFSDTSFITRARKHHGKQGKMDVWEVWASDTGSSRMLWSKYYYGDGVGFSLMTQLDTLTPPSPFLRSFYQTFTPADTLKGVDIFAKKSTLFFTDFMSRDSTVHKRAVRNIARVWLDSSDLPNLKKAIAHLTFKEKDYLQTKKGLIAKLGSMESAAAADYLGELYFAAGDTIELQYCALENLLSQKTAYAYNVFGNIVATEPPVLEKQNRGYDTDISVLYQTVLPGRESYSYTNGNFLDELNDSLPLTLTILPRLLPLLNLDDYEQPLMRLLARMVDSNLVNAKDYEMYVARFMAEAKQEMKKQVIIEKSKAIAEAEESKTESQSAYDFPGQQSRDKGNEKLDLYATLLVPSWDSGPQVKTLLQQMLGTSDKRLKYNTLMLLVRKDRPFPDTMIHYFAGLEEYRYELYSDLGKMGKAKLFPARYNTHLDLGRSRLYSMQTYGRPDTVAYINRLPATYKGKKGYIYFFRYKSKKEDMSWKLATVGLVPPDPAKFEFVMKNRAEAFPFRLFQEGNGFDFTGLTDTRIKADESLEGLMNKELKKLLYSRRNSARQFYGEDGSAVDIAELRFD